jgi:uncharacterized protein (DUF305 family)
VTLERSIHRRLAETILLAAALICLVAADDKASPPPIIQPGAPGEPGRHLSAEEASDLAAILFADVDVRFMQGMIRHHAQALEMTALLEGRSESADLRALAQRIDLSQRDEIAMMEEWLRSHGQEVPAAAGAHHAHGHELMPGMLTPEEMGRLEQARGVEFDRLFLELMIAHHRGALVMVDQLLESDGAAQESTVFAFTSDVTADQSMEIDRMASMLAGLSSDPRVGLDAGFLDAGVAALNLELVVSLPRPPGFSAPEAPAGPALPPETPDDEDDGDDQADDEGDGDEDAEDEEEADAEAETDPERKAAAAKAAAKKKAKKREEMVRMAAAMNFANSDLAFGGNDVLVQGNFHGFNLYSIADPAAPRLLSSVVCPGGQGDVSVVGNLLVLSVEQTRGRVDCGLQGVADPVSGERFRGLRIFDIGDPSMPKQVGAVQTCRGSHTHTVVTDPDGKGVFYVYGSGTAKVRADDELSGCSDAHPGEDEQSALFSIDVIEVPTAAPEKARIVSRPRIFADSKSGAIAGLWKGGDHGVGTQKTAKTDQCHDITVFPSKGLAAGACSGNGILLDISDPAKPVRLDQVVDKGFAYWHSATFNNDGTKVVFTDEWGGGMRPRCRASDPRQWGANAIFDIVDRKLVFRSYYKLPAPQTESENCVAHNGSLVPVPGRDVMVQAWYQGGVSVFDFTDSAKPFEIAFFDRGPIDAKKLVMAGHWSTYWHGGHVYGAEIARGLDVLRLVPSEHLTRNEIDAASLIDADLVNPQHQRRIDWPAAPVVARAYLDQLVRDEALPAERVDAVTRALEEAERVLAGATPADRASERSKAAAKELHALADGLDGMTAPTADRARLQSLARTLEAIARRVG